MIFLTVNQDPDIAAEAIRLGASAFLLKSSASAELISAIKLAQAGKTYITPLITKGKPLDVFLGEATRPAAEKLTARQREVLQLLAEGKQMKEAATILSSPRAPSPSTNTKLWNTGPQDRCGTGAIRRGASYRESARLVTLRVGVLQSAVYFSQDCGTPACSQPFRGAAGRQ